MIICILQKGAMGTVLYLNSQEEQIILDHVSHTGHSQLKPEQRTIFLGIFLQLPGAVCQCPLRHWSCFGFSQIIWLNTNTTGVMGKDPCWITDKHTWQTMFFIRKLNKSGAKGPSASPFLICTGSSPATDMYICTWLKHFIPLTFGRLSSICRKGKVIFLLNKLRNVNSVTSFKKTQKTKALSVLATGKMWMQTDVLVYC